MEDDMFNKIFATTVLFVVVVSGINVSFAQNDQTSMKDSTTQIKTKQDAIKDITVPSGTKFKISITSQLATNRNVEGSTFSATIAEDFIFEGDTIAAKNSQVIGKIVESKSGKGIGDARLSVQVTEISINKKLTPVVTEPITVKGERRRNAQADIAAGTIEEVTIKQALVVQKK
jgi:hypothetical protein